MNKEDPDIREGIDNELKRVQIHNHRNFSAWYEALKPHSRQVIDSILEEDVTPELILLAQEAPDDEWHSEQILRIIGGGNPNPSIQSALTNFSLQEILFAVQSFA
jgi:hypothetical protein